MLRILLYALVLVENNARTSGQLYLSAQRTDRAGSLKSTSNRNRHVIPTRDSEA